MTTQIFQNYQCWDEKRISIVINKEAVSVDRATFMATHTPLNSIAYLHSPRQIKDTSEIKFLEELCNRADNEQHTFSVIQGIPGTGKSHLIRWLKERYQIINREHDEQDVVLLIERANSSLRSTLLQIIEADVFDTSLFAEQIKRLRNATEQLSKKGLADTVLNHLQVATSEVQLGQEYLPSQRIQRNVEKFLLDYAIREELKKPGGPIERVVNFLSGQNVRGLVNDELPTFQASDFDFDINFLKKFKQQTDGYRETKKLADSLNLKPELREDLATYLNRLLHFAISRTTALSADELKQIFNDLRRELRRQGRHLALFIEDIAVFTGLDAGLVDVLATQHTGESNTEFCRILSVVGITDGYYQDHFPDNMKQRVTHRLTLNTQNYGRQESELLTNSASVANMAARYLNAIRLSQNELDEWYGNGTVSDKLPNACSTCQFQSTCHDAFGSVEINPTSDNPQSIGLYPFNQRAFWTMYSQIDTSKIARTPRTLLNNVLEYVLQSHGSKLGAGDFPPKANELGSVFTPPTLAKPTHRRLITDQISSPTQANRVETLLLFWGDGTADQTIDQQSEIMIGGLRSTVFTAFSLPVINGEQLDVTQTIEIPPTPNPPPKPRTLPIDNQIEPKPNVGSNSASPNPLKEDIERWRIGSALQNYDTFAKILMSLISSFVDWEAYGIPFELVDDRLKQGRCKIEGQAGRFDRKHHIEFSRSDELVFVLHALADLPNIDNLSPAQIGTTLATFSSWLRKEESRIVEFVRQPSRSEPIAPPITQFLVQNNLLIACLSDGLSTKNKTSVDLYLAMVRMQNVYKTVVPWRELIKIASETHSSVWVRSMENIAGSVNKCHQSLFPALNLRQGTSKDIRFINAVTILDVLDVFTKQSWQVKLVNFSADGALWEENLKIHQTFGRYFASALNLDHQQTEKYQMQLKTMLDNDSVVDIFTRTTDFLANLREQGIAYSFELDPKKTVQTLNHCVSGLNTLPNKQDTVQLAIWLSSSGPLVKAVLDHLKYLDDILALINSKEKEFEKRIASLQPTTPTNISEDDVMRKYDKLSKNLQHILSLSVETGGIQ